MLAKTIIMKKMFCGLLFESLLMSILLAETFIGPTTESNRLVIPSGKVAFVTSIVLPGNEDPPISEGDNFWVPEGSRVSLGRFGKQADDQNPVAFAGPGELILEQQLMMTFSTFSSSNFSSFFLPLTDESPVRFSVSQGKRLRIYKQPIESSERLSTSVEVAMRGILFQFRIGNNSPLNSQLDIDGPCEVTFKSLGRPYRGGLITIAIFDSGATLLSSNVIDSQSEAVQVLGSSDFKIWNPLAIIPNGDLSQRFLMIKVGE